MAEILYVSRSPVYDHIVNSDLTLESTVKILTPWNPSLSTRKFLNSRFFPKNIASLFLTRPKQFIDTQRVVTIKKINLGFWEFVVPILRKIGLVNFADHVAIYSEKRIAKRVKYYVAESNRIIMTDDFLDLELDFQQKDLILEIRGGTFLGVDQIRAIQRKPVDLYFDTDFCALTKTVSKSAKRLVQKNLDSASGFIAYSEFYRGLIRDIQPNKQIWLMPLNMPKYDIEVIAESSSQKKALLFIGRDEPIKGLDLAVNISASMNIPLNIVGTYSKSMIDKLSRVETVNLLGQLSRGELFSLMKSSSLLLSPTIETFGYSILEAASMGLPVVTSRYAGVTDWLEGNNLVHVVENFELQNWSNKVSQIMEELSIKNKLPSEPSGQLDD